MGKMGVCTSVVRCMFMRASTTRGRPLPFLAICRQPTQNWCAHVRCWMHVYARLHNTWTPAPLLGDLQTTHTKLVCARPLLDACVCAPPQHVDARSPSWRFADNPHKIGVRTSVVGCMCMRASTTRGRPLPFLAICRQPTQNWCAHVRCWMHVYARLHNTWTPAPRLGDLQTTHTKLVCARPLL